MSVQEMADFVIASQWKPIVLYKPEDYDWVLVIFKGKRMKDYLPLPYIAEKRIDGRWHIQGNEPRLENYLNDDCEPVMFRIIDAFYDKVGLLKELKK